MGQISAVSLLVQTKSSDSYLFTEVGIFLVLHSSYYTGRFNSSKVCAELTELFLLFRGQVHLSCGEEVLPYSDHTA